jgi:hypothetical protein
MEPGFTYKIENNRLIEVLKKEFYDHKKDFQPNRGKQNYEKYLGTIEENNIGAWKGSFWENHKELFYYLNEKTYPQDPEYILDKSWMKYYPKGSFSGLHTENADASVGKDQYTNVILIDQSEDIVGGVIVIAGDSIEPDYKNPNKKENIRERLITKFLKDPGDSIVWNGKTVHGVSKIEKGHRLVFVCTKTKMER